MENSYNTEWGVCMNMNIFTESKNIYCILTMCRCCKGLTPLHYHYIISSFQESLDKATIANPISQTMKLTHRSKSPTSSHTASKQLVRSIKSRAHHLPSSRIACIAAHFQRALGGKHSQDSYFSNEETEAQGVKCLTANPHSSPPLPHPLASK